RGPYQDERARPEDRAVKADHAGEEQHARATPGVQREVPQFDRRRIQRGAEQALEPDDEQGDERAGEELRAREAERGVAERPAPPPREDRELRDGPGRQGREGGRRPAPDREIGPGGEAPAGAPPD